MRQFLILPTLLTAFAAASSISEAATVPFDHTEFADHDLYVDSTNNLQTYSDHVLYSKLETGGREFITYMKFTLPEFSEPVTGAVLELGKFNDADSTVTVWSVSNYIYEDTNPTYWTENNGDGTGLNYGNRPSLDDETALLTINQGDETPGFLRETTASGSSYKLSSTALDDYINSVGSGGTLSIAFTATVNDNYWRWKSDEATSVTDFAEDYERPSLNFNVVPEPGSMALLSLGVLTVLGRRRRIKA